jgi:hypothetical protein
LALAVVENRVESLPPDATHPGTAALLLLVSRNKGITPSLIVAHNEARGRSVGQDSPVVLLAVNCGHTSEGRPPAGVTAVTGNVVVNTGTGAGVGPSLAIFPNGGRKQVAGLAVTGNVLVGVTNLEDLLLPAPLTTWVGMNSLSAPLPPPVILSILPAGAKERDPVTITGANFVAEKTSVEFAFDDTLTTEVQGSVTSPSSLTVVLPHYPSGTPGGGGDVFVTVRTPSGESVGVKYTYG